MRVWRICTRQHAAFDGEGARRYGGRWNHRGTAVVYTSESLSLAALEFFVNLDTDLSPRNLVAVAANLPEDLRIERIVLGDLPRGWRRYPAPEILQDIGMAWVAGGTTAVRSVPSAVIPEERNYLLNPVHPEFKRIRLGEPQPFHFDPRIWKRN